MNMPRPAAILARWSSVVGEESPRPIHDERGASSRNPILLRGEPAGRPREYGGADRRSRLQAAARLTVISPRSSNTATAVLPLGSGSSTVTLPGVMM